MFRQDLAKLEDLLNTEGQASWEDNQAHYQDEIVWFNLKKKVIKFARNYLEL